MTPCKNKGPKKIKTRENYGPSNIIAAALAFMLLPFLAAPQCESGSKDQARQWAYKAIECGQNPAMISPGPQISWADSQSSWQALYKDLHKNQMPPPEAPGVDFNKHGVLLIFAGEKKHAGYELELKSAEIDNKELVLEAELEQSPGKVSAQVVTAPYCLLLIDKTKVEKVRLETSINFPQKTIDLLRQPVYK